MARQADKKTSPLTAHSSKVALRLFVAAVDFTLLWSCAMALTKAYNVK